jgi:hypothetical protein
MLSVISLFMQFDVLRKQNTFPLLKMPQRIFMRYLIFLHDALEILFPLFFM